MENDKWFNEKLLVDPTRSNVNLDKFMNNNSYKNAINSILDKLNLPSIHFIHLNHTLELKILEMLQMSSDKIYLLGNWELNIQEISYSTKLPIAAICAIIGFKTL